MGSAYSIIAVFRLFVQRLYLASIHLKITHGLMRMLKITTETATITMH